MTEERPWWQGCQLSEFKERISEMPQLELLALNLEVKALLTRIATTIETKGKDADPEWVRRAQGAAGRLRERRLFLKRELTLKHEKGGSRLERREKQDAYMKAARAALDAGRLEYAVHFLICYLKPDDENGEATT